MKKYLLVLLLIVFVAPSVAFASWWNPFSWNWKALFTSPVKEEVQIEKQAPEIKPVDKPTTIIPPTKEIKKDVPTIDNSVAQKKEAQAKLEAELKLKAEQDALILKLKTLEQARVEKGQEAPFVKLSIDNITITDITDSSVKISWETSKISESKVLLDGKEYIPINGVGTNHYVVINGLKSNLFYAGSVTAISNGSWKSQDFDFSTKPTPLSISVTRKICSTDSCTINWETNHNSSGTIKVYKTSSSEFIKSENYSSDEGNEHSLVFDADPDKEYNFIITAVSDSESTEINDHLKSNPTPTPTPKLNKIIRELKVNGSDIVVNVKRGTQITITWLTSGGDTPCVVGSFPLTDGIRFLVSSSGSKTTAITKSATINLQCGDEPISDSVVVNIQ